MGADKISQIISSGTDAFLKSALRYENRIFNQIVRDVLARLEVTKEGKIASSAKNREKIIGLNNAVRNAFASSGLYGKMNDLLANFDDLEANIVSAQKGLNNINIPPSIVNPVKRLFADQVIFRMQGRGLDVDFVQPLQNELYRATLMGNNLADVIGRIETTMLGNSRVQGFVQKYSAQVARDALGQFQGTVHERIKTEYNLDAIRYVGSLVEDSRKQCARWVAKRIILDSELQTEINWAFNNGTGMIQGTTPSNFLELRGGYNCRHTAIPVRQRKTPANIITR